MSSSQPDDFSVDLATRIALHETLLEKLFLEVLKSRPDPKAALETLRESLDGSFDVSALNAGGASPSAEHQEFVRQQSLYGKELSAKFATKVARML